MAIRLLVGLFSAVTLKSMGSHARSPDASLSISMSDLAIVTPSVEELRYFYVFGIGAASFNSRIPSLHSFGCSRKILAMTLLLY